MRALPLMLGLGVALLLLYLGLSSVLGGLPLEPAPGPPSPPIVKAEESPPLGGGEVEREVEELFDYDFIYFYSPCGEEVDIITYIWCKHGEDAWEDRIQDYDPDAYPPSMFHARTKQQIYDLAQKVGRMIRSGKHAGLTSYKTTSDGEMVFHTFVKLENIGISGGTRAAPCHYVKVVWEYTRNFGMRLRSMFPTRRVPPEVWQKPPSYWK